MNAMSSRFEMRLEPELVDRLDSWRGRQDDLPSRSEAARRLIEKGLERESTASVQISDGEKLIIAMMGDLYKKLGIDRGEIDPQFVMSALVGGHNWGLAWEHQGLFHGHVDRERTVREVVDILDMWSFLEGDFEKLSEDDQAAVKKALNRERVFFLGFDGNNESEHFAIARFLIGDMKRFQSFKGRELNSHMPLLSAYRNMLPVFERIRGTLIGHGMSAAQIVEVMEAMKLRE